MFESFRTILEHEFDARKLRNPRYTLRAFAKQLGLPIGQISEIMTNKKGLSRARAAEVAQKLGLSESEQERFVDLVEAECSRSGVIRRLAKRRVQNQRNLSSKNLGFEAYRIVAEWHHFAILALTGTPQFRSDCAWIAKTLGIQEAMVEGAVHRLSDLGLLNMKKKRWIATKKQVFSPDGVSSEANRKHHEEIFRKAIESLYQTPLNERDFFETTYAFRSRDLPEIRKRTRKFTQEIVQEFGMRSERDRIYSFGNFIFPLTTGDL